MSDRPISLFLVDNDPIFRLGLATILSSHSQWEIVGQTDNLADAVTELSNNTADLIILDPTLTDETLTPEQFYQAVKNSQPQIKLCLLSYDLTEEQQQELKKIGIEGYVNKGRSIETLLENWQRIIEGELIWPIIVTSQLSEVKPRTSRGNWLSRVRKSGIEQINYHLQVINGNLKIRPISKLDKLFLKGRRRELLTARWLVEQLLPVEVIILSTNQSNTKTINANTLISTGTVGRKETELKIFEGTVEKLEYNLTNVTSFLLEIDVLEPEKKKELLELVFKQFYRIINDLKFIETPRMQLSKNGLSIIERIWRESALIFLSKYCFNEQQLSLEEMEVLVEENEDLVSREILEKIPYFTDLFNKIVLGNESELKEMTSEGQTIDNQEKILQNTIIQIANGIVALILNYFSNHERVKKNLYHSEIVSSREVAKFRNRLAWEYRKQEYWQEPKNIFESQYRLFFFSEKGIDCTVIYAPRQQELETLSGLRWTVTILLEIRDAIAPLLRASVGTVGKALVYILTQVIGRGIGLVGKGILQGVGNSLSERDYPRKPTKPNSKS
ncbi:DUF3685 domain-containing protein [Crocosphaera sp.]|uniref:DUF3685 domain-containing protein n=1 Tax=Crocosphaera sp. TaxID=2729996 RepID=UPI003F1E89E5|nr:DUF3685 domain-containing protein [Crocosphaera sp.]